MAITTHLGGVGVGNAGLDIKHLVYMPVGHVVLKMYVPHKNFHRASQYMYLYKPCTVYVYCWKNKYKPELKIQLPSRACNHRSLCALGQDLHALGMRARLNVKPWNGVGKEWHARHGPCKLVLERYMDFWAAYLWPLFKLISKPQIPHLFGNIIKCDKQNVNDLITKQSVTI